MFPGESDERSNLVEIRSVCRILWMCGAMQLSLVVRSSQATTLHLTVVQAGLVHNIVIFPAYHRKV